MVPLIFLKSQHSFRHASLAKLQSSPQLSLRVLESGPSAQIEHYECCHKPLPLSTNLETLSEVHHALGFLKEGQSSDVQQLVLEEIFEDSDDETAQRHCLKLIQGELFLFCNVNTRD